MDLLSKNVSFQAGTTILTIRPILIAPTFAPHNLLLKVVMRIFRIPLSRDTIKSKVRILRRLKTIFKNSKNALWTCPATLSNHLFSHVVFYLKKKLPVRSFQGVELHKSPLHTYIKVVT